MHPDFSPGEPSSEFPQGPVGLLGKTPAVSAHDCYTAGLERLRDLFKQPGMLDGSVAAEIRATSDALKILREFM